MAFAEDATLEAEGMTNADVQPVRQHNQPGRDFLAVGQDDLLAFLAVRNGRSLGVIVSTSGGICARRVLTSVSYMTPC